MDAIFPILSDCGRCVILRREWVVRKKSEYVDDEEETVNNFDVDCRDVVRLQCGRRLQVSVEINAVVCTTPTSYHANQPSDTRNNGLAGACCIKSYL